MKYHRLLIIAPLLLLGLLLNRNVVIADRYTGIWYTDERVYLFREGIIEQILPEETSQIDGAYIFTKNTITLFVTDLEGLKTVKELHWQHDNGNVFLFENAAGIQTIYFYREPKQITPTV